MPAEPYRHFARGHGVTTATSRPAVTPACGAATGAIAVEAVNIVDVVVIGPGGGRGRAGMALGHGLRRHRDQDPMSSIRGR